MKFILAGGGNAHQSSEVDQFFVGLLPKRKILLLPQAAVPEICDVTFMEDWIKKPIPFKDLDVHIWEHLQDKTLDELRAFDAIYISGGNTFSMLRKFRDANFISVLKQYILEGGLVYGISAGAILFGKSIDIAKLGPDGRGDENNTNLVDFNAMDLLNGWNVYTHYRDQEDAMLYEYSQQAHTNVLCLSEESGVFIDNGQVTVIGKAPVILFKHGKKQQLDPNIIFVI